MQGDNNQRDDSPQEPDAYQDTYDYSWNMERSANECEYVAAGDRKRIIFTSQEKAFVTNLITKYHVIKSKKADLATLAEKSRAWEDIARLFNAVAHHRKKTSKQLKKLWENINQIMKKRNNYEGFNGRTTPVHFKEDSTIEHTVHGAMLLNECEMSNGIEDNPSSDTHNVVPPQKMIFDILQPTQSSDFTEVSPIDRIRFTENEKEFLYDQIAMYQDILDSKKCDVYSLAEKHNAWELITRHYNAVPSHSKRTNVQLKKLWENTKARRKQECSKINEEDGIGMRFKEEPTDYLLNFDGYSNGTDDTADSDAMSSQTEGIDDDHYATQYHEERINGTEAISSKTKNSKRFTLAEKAFLAKIIMTKYNDIIGESTHTDRVSNQEKNKAWVEVTSAFNAVPHHSKRTRLQLIKLWRAMLHSRTGSGEAISLDERGTVFGQEDAASFLLKLGLINKRLDDRNDEVIESNQHHPLEAEIEPNSIYEHPSQATRKRSAAVDVSPLGLTIAQCEGNVSSNLDNDREMHLLVVEEMKQKVALARLKVKAEEAEQKRVADAHALEMAFKKQKWDLELKILRKKLNEDSSDQGRS